LVYSTGAQTILLFYHEMLVATFLNLLFHLHLAKEKVISEIDGSEDGFDISFAVQLSLP